ncbi:MAG: TolC family protein [Kiritimatiellales bacterium]|nr:TolC family protein [Kiritimatiellota bacterium]MBL7015987.1 TolC family protein [Kiritimatiellales bacterium]
MKLFQLLLPVVFLAAATPVVRADELNDYLTEAAQNNPGLEAAFNNWKAALERVPQVTALPDPRFNYGYFIQEVETRVGPQRQKFGISQVFPWFGKLSLRGDAAMEMAEAEHQRYKQAKLNLFYRVKSAFFEYDYLHRSTEITLQHLILLQNMEEVARTRFQTGEVQQSALLQLQVELGKLDDKLRALEALRVPAAIRLSAALNRPSGEPLPWPQSEEKTLAVFSDDEAQQWLKDSSPELKQVDAMIRKETDAAALARKARYPDIMLGLDYTQTDEALMSTPDSGKDPLMASVSINLPIWFGKLKAGEQEAAYRRAAAEELRVDAGNRLRADLQMALYNFRDAERKMNLYSDTLIPKAQQSLEVTREGFESGSLGFTALIEAQRTLLEFQLAADRAVADREIRLAEIEMLTGREF